MTDKLRSLLLEVEIPNQERFDMAFRVCSEGRFGSCAKVFPNMFKDSSIALLGDDVQLSEELSINAFLVSACGEDERFFFSLKSAMSLAKMYVPESLEVSLVSFEALCSWLESELGTDLEDPFSMSEEELSPSDDDEEEYVDLEEYLDGKDETEELEVVSDAYPEEEPEDDLGEVDDDALDEEPEPEVAEVAEVDPDPEGIAEYFSVIVSGHARVLIDRYDDLFSSGYALSKPLGLLSEGALAGLSGSSLKRTESASVSGIYQVMRDKMHFVESGHRSINNIVQEVARGYSAGKPLLYFPMKLLEYMSGRARPTSDNQESRHTYNTHSKSHSWSEYKKYEVSPSVIDLMRNAARRFVTEEIRISGLSDYKSDSMRASLDEFLAYFVDCLSTCVMVVEYKESIRNSLTEPAILKLRVCDPLNGLGVGNDLLDTLIVRAFGGHRGKDAFSTPLESINSSSVVKELSHEFDHKIAQAMPIFAYEAFEVLKAEKRGVANFDNSSLVSWDNMVLGKAQDGSIFKNGTNGIDLRSNMSHFIVAGSRSGKGVMTLNILASAIVSNKAVFYIDRKPDMASMFKNMAPNGFVVNGGAYNPSDDNTGMFASRNNWVSPQNVPDYASLLGNDADGLWDRYGDLFYLRAVKLVVGLILARAKSKNTRNDPRYGGTDGITLVVDEVTNAWKYFSSTLRNAIKRELPPMVKKRPRIPEPPNNGKETASYRKDVEKAVSELEDYDKVYTVPGFYLLSMLNFFNEDILAIESAKNASFALDEVGMSDIFIIGQDLQEDFSLSETFFEGLASKNNRYVQLTKGSKDIESVASLDSSGLSLIHKLVCLRNPDAFLGAQISGDQSGYLSQKSPRSKAHGKLDWVANNFAYIQGYDSARKDIVKGLGEVGAQGEKRNLELAEKAVYFKPLLILNGCQRGDSYTSDLIKRCYDNSQGGITEEILLEEKGDPNGDFLHPAIGFQGYLNLIGVSDAQSRLEKSGQVANNVVQAMGYNGSWLDFITDLRFEAMFSLTDVIDAVNKGITLDSKFSKRPEFSDYREYLSNSVKGQSGDSEEMDFNNFMADGYAPSEAPQHNDYSNPVVQDAFDSYRMRNIFGDDAPIGDDEISLDNEDSYDFYPPIQEGGVPEGYDKEFTQRTGYSPEISQLLERIRELERQLGAETSIPLDAEVDESFPDTGAHRSYERVESPEPITPKIEFGNSIESLQDLVECITENVVRQFGGLSEFRSLRVVGGALIVNEHYYKLNMGAAYMQNVPLDVRAQLNSGQYARLFDYKLLPRMKNLRILGIDSMRFALEYMSPELNHKEVNVESYFNSLSNLQMLKLGDKVFTRKNYKQEGKVAGDMFYRANMGTRFSNWSDGVLQTATKGTWNFAKERYRTGNWVKGTIGLIAAGATGSTLLGARATRWGFGHIKEAAKGLGQLIGEVDKW